MSDWSSGEASGEVADSGWGSSDWSGGDDSTVAAVTVETQRRGVFAVQCNECGRLDGEYDSEGEAQAVGREHVVAYHGPGWVVIAL